MEKRDLQLLLFITFSVVVAVQGIRLSLPVVQKLGQKNVAQKANCSGSLEAV